MFGQNQAVVLGQTFALILFSLPPCPELHLPPELACEVIEQDSFIQVY